MLNLKRWIKEATVIRYKPMLGITLRNMSHTEFLEAGQCLSHLNSLYQHEQSRRNLR